MNLQDLDPAPLFFSFYGVEQESCDVIVLVFVFIYPAR